MYWGDIAVWALTLATLTLTVVLYIRVDIHDWGMVGFTVMMFGASVLLVRWVVKMHGWGDADELYVVWRLLVLIGTPFALTGYVLGMVREPPPMRQVLCRLALLVVIVTVAVMIGVLE